MRFIHRHTQEIAEAFKLQPGHEKPEQLVLWGTLHPDPHDGSLGFLKNARKPPIRVFPGDWVVRNQQGQYTRYATKQFLRDFDALGMDAWLPGDHHPAADGWYVTYAVTFHSDGQGGEFVVHKGTGTSYFKNGKWLLETDRLKVICWIPVPTPPAHFLEDLLEAAEQARAAARVVP